MVRVDGDNRIYMTRGDSATFDIVPTFENQEYTPLASDKIVFTVKETYKSKEPVIEKVIPNDTLVLTLHPEDTKNLRAPAKYVYDVYIMSASGAKDTFIPNAEFNLKENVGEWSIS